MPRERNRNYQMISHIRSGVERLNDFITRYEEATGADLSEKKAWLVEFQKWALNEQLKCLNQDLAPKSE